MGSWKDFIFGVPFEEQKRRLENNPSSVSGEEYRQKMENLNQLIWERDHPREVQRARLQEEHRIHRVSTENNQYAPLPPLYYSLNDEERTAVHWQASRDKEKTMTDPTCPNSPFLDS